MAYVSLGSNRGNRKARLQRALVEISRVAPVLGVSSFYRTDPVSFTDQADFWNAVAVIAWEGSAVRLLRALREVERRVGRTPSFRHGPREIDVDILDLGGEIRASPDPILPHPRMENRRFVLAPLAEVDPEWRHPKTGRTATELLHDLPERPRATKLSSRPKGFAGRLPGS
ncbi:MAG TPA: 2-amino-4-hydroxy-6-hydroxymethyldihydropteridine diphosphokinase [Thermoanaerobaculia bacterium]